VATLPMSGRGDGGRITWAEMSAADAATVNGTRSSGTALRGWLLAGSVYFLAVFHRSSLGVAGLLAERRFGIDAGQLSVFVLLQIGVYAAMQVPTGILVDRYGPRRLLVIAGALMGVAQVGFAIAPSYPAALLARAALGAGDAMTFISVLRYAARHFSPRRYPVVVTLTGTLGIIGNVLATLPLALLLNGLGWTRSYLLAGCLSLVGAVLLLVLLGDDTARPARIRGRTQLQRGIANVGGRLRDAWSLPGTRLGFWVHFACMSAATSLSVLWGHPYLVDGVGLSDTAASAVLLVGVAACGICGPLIGLAIGHRPAWRVPLALCTCTVSIVGWTLVITAFGNTPPSAVACSVFVLSMAGSPVSMIAFAVTRDYNRPHTIGTASGAVNVGGFLATVAVCLLFGWTLNLMGGSSPHALRIAMLVAVAVQAFGTLRVAMWYRRTRAEVRARQTAGDTVPVRVERRRWWDLPDLPTAAPEARVADARQAETISQTVAG
jgi:MFS family permease